MICSYALLSLNLTLLRLGHIHSTKHYFNERMDWIVLSTVTLTASILQTVTGFGFGLLCVPIFLWVVDSIAAIQLVIIVTLVMSIAIWPSVKGQMVPKLLTAFGIGCVIGSPIGITIFSQLNLNWIKVLAAIVILVVTLWNAYIYFMPLILKHDLFKHPHEGTRPVQIGVGVASGILGSTLAMPAPLVMLYLSGTCYQKNAIRSTILVFFILAYGLALVCQMATVGVTGQTWKMAATLCPAALAGVFIGHKLAPFLSIFYFRLIVFLTLLITSLVMLVNVMSSWSG